MTQTVDAVFENGLLKPLGQLQLAEGEAVQLTVTTRGRRAPPEIIELAQKVYEGLLPQEVDEIEESIKRRPNFFSRPVEPD
jgi:predicted DNA-binding antitoxin AbrB/MazE fold protein